VFSKDVSAREEIKKAPSDISSKGAFLSEARFHLDFSLRFQQTLAFYAGIRRHSSHHSSGVVFAIRSTEREFQQVSLLSGCVSEVTLSVIAFSFSFCYYSPAFLFCQVQNVKTFGIC